MIKFNSLVKVPEIDAVTVDRLSKNLNVSRLTSMVLINRGITDLDKAKTFLNPRIEDFLNPFLLKDMDIAVNRIIKAIDKNENIWIYGDYDVDGVTSTSVLIIFLRSVCKNIDFYIPDRMTEGYGLNKEAIDFIKSKEGQLIISVDCGIQSFEVAEYCRTVGIDLIITDHHTCGEKLPVATAVVNPNRYDNEYSFSKLAGVGVALKLIQALAQKLNVPIIYEDILPIVAIGTVADVVSLTGENRVIVKNGLAMIKTTNNQGIKALLEVTGLANKEITSGHIGFIIGPRINATGRIGLAKHAVQLFITEDYEEAYHLAKMLEEENMKRQNIETQILKEAEDIINKEVDLEKEKILVVASENWHHGVIGIVSSRITEKYYRPSILISIEGDEGRGSARSIPTFNLYENLNKCKDLFVKFGGHSQAAGLTIKKEYIMEFKKQINDIANEVLDEFDLIPETTVDAEINAEDILLELANDLKALEPFGVENPSPCFLLKGACVKLVRPVSKDGKHVKLTVEKDGKCFECIGFNFKSYLNILKVGQKNDFIVSIDINDYLGQQSIQLIIKDIIVPYNDGLVESEEYLNSLFSIVKNTNEDTDFKLINLPVQKLNDNERINYVINYIKENDNVLLIINNFLNLSRLLNAMQYEGRDFIRRLSISYGIAMKHKSCNIIVNPIVSEMDANRYDKVILYDLCFTKDYLESIVKCFKGKNFQILVSENDIISNKHFIEDILPTIDDIRLIYKTLISKKDEYLRIQVNEYLISIFNKTGVDISISRFMTIMEILKSAKLLNYVVRDKFLIVKVFEKPNNKIDITNVSIYDKLYNIHKEINDLKMYYYLIKRRKHDGF